MCSIKVLVVLDDGTQVLASVEQPMPRQRVCMGAGGEHSPRLGSDRCFWCGAKMPQAALTTQGETVADWRAA